MFSFLMSVVLKITLYTLVKKFGLSSCTAFGSSILQQAQHIVVNSKNCCLQELKGHCDIEHLCNLKYMLLKHR